MPTGYTSFINEGKVKTPKEFLHLCLRNFGVCISMRDESLDIDTDYTPKITAFYQENIDYHKKKLKSAEKNLKKIQKMSDDELYQLYYKQQSENKEYYEKTIQEYERVNARYDAFAEKIRNWECSTEYESVKRFALDQLNISKEKPDYYKDELAEIGDLSRESFEKEKEKYRNSLIDQEQWNVKYHTDEMHKVEERQADALSFYQNFKKELEKLG